MHKVTLDSKTLEISKFGAREGWKLIRKLSSLAGPAMADIAEDNYSAAMDSLFKSLPEDDFMLLLEQLTSVCLVDGAKYNDSHLGDYMFTIKVCKEVLAYNFTDFFSPIKEAFVALSSQGKKRN